MDRLRIISGEFGGRRIGAPRGRTTHPMGDRERSALFNSLHDKLAGKLVLDAFAGSGSIGLEALSRGSVFAVFLEKDRTALKVLRQNITDLNLDERSRIVSKPGQLEGYNFDIIFADPPYDNPQMELILRLLRHLAPQSLFVFSHSKLFTPPKLKGFELIFDKTYAAAQIKIYQKLA